MSDEEAKFKRRITVELYDDLVEWISNIARMRGESLSTVMNWTLGLLRNFYDRWLMALELHVRRRMEEESKIREEEEMERRLDEELERFKEFLQAKGYRRADYYYEIAKRFVEWLLQRSKRDLSTEAIEEFLEGLNVKQSTKATYRHLLKAFLNFQKESVKGQASKA